METLRLIGHNNIYDETRAKHPHTNSYLLEQLFLWIFGKTRLSHDVTAIVVQFVCSCVVSQTLKVKTKGSRYEFATTWSSSSQTQVVYARSHARRAATAMLAPVSPAVDVKQLGAKDNPVGVGKPSVTKRAKKSDNSALIDMTWRWRRRPEAVVWQAAVRRQCAVGGVAARSDGGAAALRCDGGVVGGGVVAVSGRAGLRCGGDAVRRRCGRRQQ